MNTYIHRGGLNGKPRCGAESGRISFSGIRQFLTCPACLALDKPVSRAEALAALEAQIKAMHAKREVNA